MKNTFILIAFCLASGLIHAQKVKESDLPSSVRTSFGKLFPTATEVKWSKESATEFEAEFKMGKEKKSSNFDQVGKWLGTETEIKEMKLPAAVRSVIAKDYAGYKIIEAEKAETPDKGSFYELELKKGSSKIEVRIKDDGKIVTD